MVKYKCSVCGYIYDEEKEGKPLQLRRSWLMIRHTPVVTPVAVIWTISMKWL